MRFLAFFFLLTSMAWGTTPSISSTSGTFSDGNTIIISGSSFGTKSPAAPYKFDDFENGVDGEIIENGWTNYDDRTDYRAPRYENTDPRTGSTLSSYHYFTHPVQGSHISLITLDWDEVYVSYWRKLNLTVIGTPKNYKEFRMEGDRGDQTPMLAFDANWSPDDPSSMKAVYIANYDPLYQGIDWAAFTSYKNDTWDRHEFWIRIADSPGQRCKIWDNGTLRRDYDSPDDFPGGVGPHLGDDSTSFTELYFGFWIRSGSTGDALFDDIYVDITQARVEIGDASTFGACSHREIQIPSAWAAGEITVTCYQGSFGGAENAYLYVVDADGDVSAGYAIQFGSGGGGQPGSGRPCIIQ